MACVIYGVMTVNFNPDLSSMLQMRVQEIREQRRGLAATLKDLEAQETAYLRALEAENRRLNATTRGPQTGTDDSPPSTRLREQFATGPKEFVLEALADGEDWSLNSLKQLAESRKLYIPEDQAVGRVLHGALMGLLSGKRVQIVGRGVWRLRQNTPSGSSDGVSD